MRDGELIDIPFIGAITRPQGEWILVVSLGIALLMALAGVALLIGTGSWFTALLFVPLFVLVSRIVPRFSAEKRAVRAALNAPDYSLPEVVEKLVHKIAGTGASRGLRELVRLLAQRGTKGITFRLWQPGRDPQIDPVRVPFEPQPLEEAELPTEERPHESSRLFGPDSNHDARSDVSPWKRRLGRNVVMGGGWIIVAMLGFNLVIAGLASIRQRRITFEAALWLLYLVLVFALPRGVGILQRRQWLLVPSGIIVRWAGWWQPRWKVHLFARTDSVLLVGRHQGKQWLAYVADAEACEEVLATDGEIRAMLRAWLSPLPPPARERLADLA